MATQAKVKGNLFDVLVEANPMPLPKALVEEEVDRMVEQMEQRTGIKAKGGIPRELFTEQAERRTALSVLLGELVRASGLQPDAERVRQQIEKIASGYENPAEVVKWYYGNREQLSSVEMAVLEDQVTDWVLERAKVVEETLGFQEMMKAPGESDDDDSAAATDDSEGKEDDGE